MYQHKIYGSDKDFLGIVFFGTEKNNTGEDFLHMFMLQVRSLLQKNILIFQPRKIKWSRKDLEQPSADRIKQIETFSQGCLIII